MVAVVKRSQSQRLIDLLATGRSITPLMALRLIGTLRLGARVYDLRRQGHKIETDMVVRHGARVAAYRLAR